MSLDFINLLTTLHQGLLGLALYLAPDYFWNPDDGILPSLATRTSLESNHFTKMDKLVLMGSGATMLSFLIFHLFFMKDEADKRTFMRVKLVSYIAKLVLLAHTAFVNESDMFNKEFLALITAVHFCAVLWLSAALFTTKPPKKDRQVVRTKQAQFINLFTIVYTVFWATILMFATELLSPSGPFPFTAKTGTDDNTFDALQIFVRRFEGTNLICTLAYIWNFSTTPDQMEKLNRTDMLLYTLVFVLGALDTTGFCHTKVYTMQLLFHLIAIVGTLYKTTETSEKVRTKNQ